MDCKKFEEVLSMHCSPVLMGRKPSNLVSFSKQEMPDIPELVEFYAEKLKKNCIFMEIICQCRTHYQILVYRPDMLKRCLTLKGAQRILREAGYPEDASLNGLLRHLRHRFEERRDFPHEIGLFLGYPLEDVEGFCKYKGKACKLCGYWKVYGDVDSALRQFAVYEESRAFLAGRLRRGSTILQLMKQKELCVQSFAC